MSFDIPRGRKSAFFINRGGVAPLIYYGRNDPFLYICVVEYLWILFGCSTNE